MYELLTVPWGCSATSSGATASGDLPLGIESEFVDNGDAAAPRARVSTARKTEGMIVVVVVVVREEMNDVDERGIGGPQRS